MYHGRSWQTSCFQKCTIATSTEKELSMPWFHNVSHSISCFFIQGRIPGNHFEEQGTSTLGVLSPIQTTWNPSPMAFVLVLFADTP